MPKPRSACALAGALFLVACAATSCITNRYTAKAKDTISVKYIPATPIHVTTRNGGIEVIGGVKGDDVVVHATITASGETQAEADRRLDRVKVRCERDDDERLIIRADFGGNPRGRDGVSYRIELPDADGAQLRTSNGSVKVSAIAGFLDIRTSNGRIEVIDHSGEVKADTSNGRVVAKDVSGPLDVDTSNGSVTVEMRPEAAGPLAVKTSNGPVNVTVGRGFRGRLKAKTSNGRVRFENRTGLDVGKQLRKRSGYLEFPGDGKDSSIRSSNGSVKITVTDRSGIGLGR